VNAAAYRVLMVVGLPRPRERPDVFTRVSTILMCGIGYAVAVWCLWVLGTRVGLPPAWRLVWLAGFALATMLPAYTRQLNSGMPQLGATAALALLLTYIRWPGGRLCDAPVSASRSFEDSVPATRTTDRNSAAQSQVLTSPSRGEVNPTPRSARLVKACVLVAAGACAGFGFTIDQASGAPLLALATVVVFLRTRGLTSTAIFLAGALPWVVAHLGVNYAVGGVLVPLNMVPEYLRWPGSPFDESNMTGVARHTLLGLVDYLRELLIGESGFLIFNLPLLLAVVMGWLAVVRSVPDRLELATMIAWSVIVVAVYAVLSDNLGGFCLSIRWFVPLLVPGFWVLARLLVECPTLRIDFTVLAAIGFVVSGWSWPCGPWLMEEQPSILSLARAAVIAWIAVRVAVRLRQTGGRQSAGVRSS